MDDEELERTGILQSISKYDDDESYILEIVEEYEDRIDYLDIDEDKKKEIKKLCLEIKRTENEEEMEELYSKLKELVEE